MTSARANVALMMSWMTLVGTRCRHVWCVKCVILMQNLWAVREGSDGGRISMVQ